MRTSILSRSSLVALSMALLIALLSGCGRPDERPNQAKTPAQIDGTWYQLGDEEAAALWLTTTNYKNSGYLSRIDLSNGRINATAVKIGLDSKITRDRSDGFFLLNRGSESSITRLEGQGAVAKESLQLEELPNLQDAVRDEKGRVWLVALDSSKVQVRSSDLKTKITELDLASLKDSVDEYPELSNLLLLPDGRMLVLAQRLKRGRVWSPEAYSGVAMIRTEPQIEIEWTKLIPCPNPSQMVYLDGKLVVSCSGDLSFSTELAGGESEINLVTGEVMSKIFEDGKLILDQFFWKRLGDGVRILWWPKQSRSCLEARGRQVVCRGTDSSDLGVVWNRAIRVGRLIVASSNQKQAPKLNFYNLLESKELGSVPWSLPIEGIQTGP